MTPSPRAQQAHNSAVSITSENNRRYGFLVDDSNQAVVKRSYLVGSNHLDDVDRVLSEKLNNMSIEERTLGIHELHGVADNTVETPELLKGKLEEMTQIADKLPEANTEAYRMALTMDKDSKYVERIKLWCLRADKHDTQKAAKRITTFFTSKRQLFPDDEKLAREITIDDFQGTDREVLEAGVFQLLQERDRAGRAVILLVCRVAARYRGSSVSILRAFYFVSMNALRDLETQRKGVVLIVHALGLPDFQSEGPSKFAQSLFCAPVRIVAIHCLYESKLMDLAMKMFSPRLEGRLLCRLRGHLGTYMECIYNLMTFGIPKYALPIKIENGDIDLQFHHEWLETLNARERAMRLPGKLTPLAEEVVIMGPMDIIVGRTHRKSRSSPGYVRLRTLIEEQREEYEKVSKAVKVRITRRVLSACEEAGCRFLRRTSEGLVICDETQSRDKIAHTFRNMRRSTTKAGREKAANAKNDRKKASKRELPCPVTS